MRLKRTASTLVCYQHNLHPVTDISASVKVCKSAGRLSPSAHHYSASVMKPSKICRINTTSYKFQVPVITSGLYLPAVSQLYRRKLLPILLFSFSAKDLRFYTSVVVFCFFFINKTNLHLKKK